MKVIVAGSRSITDDEIVHRAIRDSKFDITEIVSGGAKGVDICGENYAIGNEITIVRFIPDWKNLNVDPCVIGINNYGKYNKLAGHIRNEEMAKYADCLVLVWDGKSSGSRNMFKLAKDYNLEIFQKVI